MGVSLSTWTLALVITATACASPAPTLDARDGGTVDADPAREYVALAGDFADYGTWRRVDLGETVLAGHPPGHRYGYIRTPVPARDAAGHYATGTMIVKEIHVTDDPATWDLFAMVKRGGTYDADGATGWEFFLLAPTGRGTARIVTRGTAPMSGTVDAYTGLGFDCNTCHGTADSAEYDHVLSPELQP